MLPTAITSHSRRRSLFTLVLYGGSRKYGLQKAHQGCLTQGHRRGIKQASHSVKWRHADSPCRQHSSLKQFEAQQRSHLHRSRRAFRTEMSKVLQSRDGDLSVASIPKMYCLRLPRNLDMKSPTAMMNWSSWTMKKLHVSLLEALVLPGPDDNK